MRHSNLNTLFMCFLVVLIISSASAQTHYLHPGQEFEYNPHKLSINERENLQIYCYKGRPKYIIHIWQSVSLQVDHKTDNYVQYDGQSPEQVKQEFTEKRSSWSINLFTWKQKHFKLNPFNQSCIGIESTDSYVVSLHVIRIDYWKIILLISGLLLFLSAPRLSNNSLFYYLCGISLGICASFLVLIYFASKLFPKKPMMYGFVIGGWTVGVYLLQMLWDNFRVIITTHQIYVMWYTLITGLISFILCYRLGPVTNPRSKNLIKWTLQSLSLFMIFHSSHFQEAAMGIIVILLVAYNFPSAWVSKSKSYWKRKFPPKVKLLSNDEYYQQGVLETTKALNELREYCSSPKCNQWKTILTIQNAKRNQETNYFKDLILRMELQKLENHRFASFVEGNSHISDEEILEYESESCHRSDLTEDEEDMTDDDSDVPDY